jgi:N,N'-diacetyllegionaminate synthase
MRCEVIAEVGWNHLGDMDLARRMIQAAAESGADVVKFQTWHADRLTSGPWDTDGRREIYRAAELRPEHYPILMDACREHGVRFLTSVFAAADVPFVAELGLQEIKIPSQEAYSGDLLRAVDGRFDRVLVSTGASEWDEVLRVPTLIQRSALTLLHCVSAYPCDAGRVNLPRLQALKKVTPSVGYSGHLQAVDDAVAAIALGVDYVEKHFTIDRSLPGRDNQFALLPEQFRQICRFRDTWMEMSIDHGRQLQDCELDVKDRYRGRWAAGEGSTAG